MPRKPETRIAKLKRQMSGNAERPCYFTTDDLPTPRGRRSPTTFIDGERVPAFEGDEAWFLMERVKATPWNYWVAIEQVEAPAWKTRGVPTP